MDRLASKRALLRLLKWQNILESGALANMRTHRLPPWPKTHMRIVGENKTLCGRPLRNNGEWAWQFYNRGHFPDRIPSGMLDRDACRVCVSTEVMQAMVSLRSKHYQEQLEQLRDWLEKNDPQTRKRKEK